MTKSKVCHPEIHATIWFETVCTAVVKSVLPKMFAMANLKYVKHYWVIQHLDHDINQAQELEQVIYWSEGRWFSVTIIQSTS